jgi:hypothetical protein
MNFTRRMIAGLGRVSRSLLTTLPASASTISAFPSMTSRRARRTGTMVSGSKDAFSARQRTGSGSSHENRQRRPREDVPGGTRS